ncbi:MAG: class I SAM-dependent methyltransferase, partial [Alphaproteobacteria bacterium]|nr:class I SAM-dependent methyltransferase [Alphaproteobacteria bacterium]
MLRVFRKREARPEPDGDAERPAKPRLSDRLQSWLDGTDETEPAVTGARARRMLSAVPDEQPAAPAAEALQAQPLADDAPSGVETHLQERLYGEGFSLPGGALFALELADAAAIGGSARVLDLTAGLGGGVRAIAEEYDIRVEGLEPNGHLAERGMVLSARSGLGTQAPITAFDPATLSLSEQSFDVIILRERLYAMPEKAQILDIARRALVPGGRLLLVDFVADADQEAHADVLEAWRAVEPESANPWTWSAYEEYLQAGGLDIEALDDMSRHYRQAVLQDWARFAGSLTRAELTPA